MKAVGVHPRVILVASLSLVLVSCGQRESSLPLVGYVEGEFVYMAAPAAGTLQTLHVARGETVAAGAPLFQIDPTPQQAALAAAEARGAARQARLADLGKGRRPSELAALEAQVHEAEASLRFVAADFERQRALLASGTTATRDHDLAAVAQAQAAERLARLRAELETAREGARADERVAAGADVAAAEADIKQARWVLSQQAPVAAHAGLVHDVVYAEGEWVPAGRPVVVLLPPARVKVRVYVPESRLAEVPPGATARITASGSVSPLTGTVVYRSPRAEYAPPVLYGREHRERLLYLVELAVDSAQASGLHPGQPVDIEFADLP